MEAASVAVNDHLWPFFASEIPWGGIKSSGMGRTSGEEGLRAMSYPKVISFDRFNASRDFWWAPVRPMTFYYFRQLIPFLYSGSLRTKLRALGRMIALTFQRPWQAVEVEPEVEPSE